MDKLIYVCSPYQGNVEANVDFARRCCLYVVGEGCIPFAPHLLFTQFLNDDVPSERKRGMELALDVLARCDEMWVFGAEISAGMQSEQDFAAKIGVKIRCIFESELSKC